MKAIDFHSVDAMLNLIFLQFVIGDTPLLNETYIRMFMSINEVENLFYEKKNSFKTNFKAEIVGNFLNTHGQHLIIIIANHGQNVRSYHHWSWLHEEDFCWYFLYLYWPIQVKHCWKITFVGPKNTQMLTIGSILVVFIMQL